MSTVPRFWFALSRRQFAAMTGCRSQWRAVIHTPQALAGAIRQGLPYFNISGLPSKL